MTHTFATPFSSILLPHSHHTTNGVNEPANRLYRYICIYSMLVCIRFWCREQNTLVQQSTGSSGSNVSLLVLTWPGEAVVSVKKNGFFCDHQVSC